MTTNSRFTINGLALIVSATWLWVLLGNVFLDPWLLGVTTSLLYAVTIFGLYRFNQTGQRFHVTAIGLATLALAVSMFTLWGQLIDLHLLISSPPSLPTLYLSSFLGGIFSAAVIAIVFFYPVSVLMPRYAWLVPVISTAFVVWIQFDSLSDPQASVFVKRVMFFELACLLVVSPLLIRFLDSCMKKYQVGVSLRQ